MALHAPLTPGPWPSRTSNLGTIFPGESMAVCSPHPGALPVPLPGSPKLAQILRNLGELGAERLASTHAKGPGLWRAQQKLLGSRIEKLNAGRT